MQAAFKILIVDDNPGMLKVCSAILTNGGYEVATAEDGFSALLYLAKILPDLILCDLNLPRMSGFELLAAVRRRFPQVRVLAMSGAYAGTDVPGGVLADAFYSKGQSPAQFLETVASLLLTVAPSRHRRELAAVWIPLNSTGLDGKQYVVITCPDCFRTFPLTVVAAPSHEVLTTSCFFCSCEVGYRNDFSRVSAISKDSSADLHSAEMTAADEASDGAVNDEIASQVPLI